MNKLIALIYLLAMGTLFTGSLIEAFHSQYPKATYFMVCFGIMAWWLNKALEDK